jgi:hypothetical protein
VNALNGNSEKEKKHFPTKEDSRKNMWVTDKSAMVERSRSKSNQIESQGESGSRREACGSSGTGDDGHIYTRNMMR